MARKQQALTIVSARASFWLFMHVDYLLVGIILRVPSRAVILTINIYADNIVANCKYAKEEN